MLDNISNHEMPRTYNLKEFANLTGKSEALIYRRLTEQPPRFVVRFARKEGARWVFDKKCVDIAIASNESLIVDQQKSIDQDTAIQYITNRFRSCRKDSK